jgi:hypothetical protein
MDFYVPLLSSVFRRDKHVYPGNQNDPTMFAGVTESLITRYRQFAKECEQITLVFATFSVSYFEN